MASGSALLAAEQRRPMRTQEDKGTSSPTPACHNATMLIPEAQNHRGISKAPPRRRSSRIAKILAVKKNFISHTNTEYQEACTRQLLSLVI
jgi:hypothetical protein